MWGLSINLKVAIAGIHRVCDRINHMVDSRRLHWIDTASKNKHISFCNKQRLNYDTTVQVYGIGEEDFVGLVLHVTQVLKIKDCNV